MSVTSTCMQIGRAQKQLSPRMSSSQIAWGPGLAKLFVAGATLGPFLDGIHGTVHLLNYDSLPLEIGGLHSSYWVPLLLGCFYAVAGSLQVNWLKERPLDRGCVLLCALAHLGATDNVHALLPATQPPASGIASLIPGWVSDTFGTHASDMRSGAISQHTGMSSTVCAGAAG